MFENINWIAVFLAGISNMVIGALWYGPILFGNQWMKLVGISEAELKKSTAQLPRIYGLTFLAALFSAVVLSRFANMLNFTDPAMGMELAFWMWAGFVATSMLTNILFERDSAKLFFINAGYQLAAMLAAGAIVTGWR